MVKPTVRVFSHLQHPNQPFIPKYFIVVQRFLFNCCLSSKDIKWRQKCLLNFDVDCIISCNQFLIMIKLKTESVKTLATDLCRTVRAPKFIRYYYQNPIKGSVSYLEHYLENTIINTQAQAHGHEKIKDKSLKSLHIGCKKQIQYLSIKKI